MKALADGHFAPITFSWGFLDAPFAVASQQLTGWRTALKRRFTVREGDSDLSSALGLLDPLTTPWTKELLICTRSPWAAYFNNQTIGGDPFPPVSYLSELLGCRGLIVQSFPDDSHGFTLTGPERTDFLNVTRSVMALYDGNGRWRFSERGSPLPFEETARYARRKIRQRLDDEMLERYFAEFGIRLFTEDFYGGNYMMLSMRQEGNHESRLSLDQYRQGLMPQRRRRTLIRDLLRIGTWHKEPFA